MNRLVSSLLFVFVYWLVLLLITNVAYADDVEITIADDSYAFVPLNFGFPLYGQVFTHSFMYDNGVVGLYDPTAGTGCNPANMWCAPTDWDPQGAWESWNTGGLNAQAFSYLISPFWTDIAPDSTTQYFINSGDTTQTYKWNNMVEFYSIYGNPDQREGGARYSSFELELLQSGQIFSRYGDTNLNTSNVWTGITGDVSNGEIMQYQPLIEYGTQVSTGINIRDWEVSSAGTISATIYNTCKSDPLSSTECLGYADAFLAQQCAVDSLYDTTCDGYGNAYVDYQCDIDPLFSPACAGYSSAIATIDDTYSDTMYDEQFDGQDMGMSDNCTTDAGCTDEFENSTIYEEDNFFNAGPEDFNYNTDQFQSPVDDYIDPSKEYDNYGYETDTPGSDIGGVGDGYNDESQTGFQEDDLFGQTEDIYTEQPFSPADAINEDGKISTEQVAKAAAEINEDIYEEKFLNEEKILLDDMKITDILEEDFLEEDFIKEEILEPEFQEKELTIAEEEKAEASPSDPKRNNSAISIAIQESRQLIRDAETASVSSGSGSSQSANNGNSDSSGSDNSGNNGSNSGNNGDISSSGDGFTGEPSFDGGASSFDGSFSAEEQFFSTDLSLMSAMTGQTGLELENVSNNDQFTQNAQDMNQNIALGDAAPIGFSISEPVIDQVEVEVPQVPSLADRIAEITRVQNIENSNAAASGQILALGALASGANLEAYYTTLDYNSVVYQDEQVYRDAQLSDNTVTHYNLFSKSHGKMQAMIRSQYER